MKRLFIILCLCLALLTGCAESNNAVHTPSAPATIEASTPIVPIPQKQNDTSAVIEETPPGKAVASPVQQESDEAPATDADASAGTAETIVEAAPTVVETMPTVEEMRETGFRCRIYVEQTENDLLIYCLYT